MPQMGFIPGPGDRGETPLEHSLSLVGTIKQLQYADQFAKLQQQKLQSDLVVQELNKRLLEFQLSKAPETFEMSIARQRAELDLAQAQKVQSETATALDQFQLDEAKSPITRILKRSAQFLEVGKAGAGLTGEVLRNQIAQEQLSDYRKANSELEGLAPLARNMLDGQLKTQGIEDPRTRAMLAGLGAQQAVGLAMSKLADTMGVLTQNNALANRQESARLQALDAIRQGVISGKLDPVAGVGAMVPYMKSSDELVSAQTLAMASGMKYSAQVQKAIDSGQPPEIIGALIAKDMFGGNLPPWISERRRVGDTFTSPVKEMGENAQQWLKQQKLSQQKMQEDLGGIKMGTGSVSVKTRRTASGLPAGKYTEVMIGGKPVKFGYEEGFVKGQPVVFLTEVTPEEAAQLPPGTYYKLKGSDQAMVIPED